MQKSEISEEPTAQPRVIPISPELAEKLDLSLLPTEVEDCARRAFQCGDMEALNRELGQAGRTHWPGIVCRNCEILKLASCYEIHLLHALVFSSGTYKYPHGYLRGMISRADRSKLIEAGEPLLPLGTFTLYRGCSGIGSRRKIRGFFWTSGFETAQGYAYIDPYEDPAVYRIHVKANAILAYYHLWNHEEYLVSVPAGVTPVRVEA